LKNLLPVTVANILPPVLRKNLNTLLSFRGYHVYKSIWTYKISEKLRCDREENNANDKFAVKLVRNDGNKE
jgi:isopropylmalate/homocitrate/citramalate synthase